MTKNELVGRVAVRLLKEKIQVEENGIARFLLDCLTPEQTGAIAQGVLKDDFLNSLIEIRLPRKFVGHIGLSEAILTDQRATYFRSASCPKSAYLLANVGDDEQQSLKELIPIGESEMKCNPRLWVEAASDGTSLPDEQKKCWEKGLQGLLEVRSIPLDRFSDFVLEIRNSIFEGHDVLKAMGQAFPKIQIPKDSVYFVSNLDKKTANHVSKWKTLFSNAIKKRACYLLKQTPAQSPLFEETLQAAFKKVRDSIPEDCHQKIRDFIPTPTGWNQSAEALAHCEWENIKFLFDGLKKEPFNLGQETLKFYAEREKELLSDDERNYLDRLAQTKISEPNEEDEMFFREHRKELRENPSLKVKWDKFIFGAPIEHEDFLIGLVLCLESLFEQDFGESERILTIRCEHQTPKDLKSLNESAGLFFTQRYRGIQRYFGPSVKWEVGKLFDYGKLTKEWRSARKPFVNRSTARGALQMKFFLELEITESNRQRNASSRQFIWVFNPDAMGIELFNDWERLAEHPFPHCSTNRSSISVKGRFQSLNLKDVSTLMPTFGRDRGSFVPIYKKIHDISVRFEENLKEASRRELLKKDDAGRIAESFAALKESYSSAVQKFPEDGFQNPSILQQREDYGNALELICRTARGDTLRELLLKPLLEIGNIQVEGNPSTVIIPPWHPLRFSAMLYKILQVSGLIKHLLTTDNVYFGDSSLFFKEIQSELGHPYYPEVVLGWREKKPELLSLTDSYLDYSLHEIPIRHGNEFDYTNEDPAKSSLVVLDLIKRYLALYPHEKANLAVVLFNCDSARLPEAIVEKLGELNEDIEDMRCQVILRHRDSRKLRDLYEKIIEADQTDPDTFVSSEISSDFMARLRIGIMADQAPSPDPKDGPPADLVFLQDAISRHAKVEWFLEKIKTVDGENFYPPRWSRKKPSASDDMKSVSFLCCPAQTKEGWAFLTALTTFIKGDWDCRDNFCLLPGRQLDFCEPETASIFKEIHNLGNWVVNYDELLDKRQLMNQGVRVIRYKQSHSQDRNLLISSTSSLGLLTSMIGSRVKDLNLNLPPNDIQKLTERFIDDANRISGDIVLRAAKRGKNASELMGVVLSSYLIRREYPKDRLWGWFFLDDYAEWFGQKEERLADILALSPTMEDSGKLRLSIIISEAKYIEFSSLSEKRKDSLKQLRETLLRIADAIFGNPKRIDRDHWLSRLADLFISGIQFPASSDINITAWRNAIREGDCEISIRGYSHIFISGPSDSPECSEMVEITDKEMFQEIFSRSDLKELVLSYFQNKDPIKIRRRISGKDIWKEELFRKPSDRVLIAVNKEIVGDEEVEPVKKQVDPKPVQPALPLPPPDVTTKPSTTLVEISTIDSTEKIFSCAGIQEIVDRFQGGQKETTDEQEWLKAIESQCRLALQHFQMRSKVVGSFLTPNAVILKFQGDETLTVEHVRKRQSEFLTTHKVNIIAARAEPGVVSLTIARPNRRILNLLDVWKTWQPQCGGGNHELLIGVKEEDGRHLFLSPTKHSPHTLIAGATGSGKSILMQNIILSISCTNTPKQAQIVLIDPKQGVDYFSFEGLPHLQGNRIITNSEESISALAQLIEVMNCRYSTLRQNRVSNLFELNKKLPLEEQLPVLWIIHDEFATWMMTEDYKASVSEIVGRLGVQARAAGIFLIFAAQRPDANVMPMQLRDNLGNRLVLKVSSEGTSEIALGEKGAERLLGKGHLAARLEGENEIIFAQVPFLNPDELEKIVTQIK